MSEQPPVAPKAPAEESKKLQSLARRLGISTEDLTSATKPRSKRVRRRPAYLDAPQTREEQEALQRALSASVRQTKQQDETGEGDDREEADVPAKTNVPAEASVLAEADVPAEAQEEAEPAETVSEKSKETAKKETKKRLRKRAFSFEGDVSCTGELFYRMRQFTATDLRLGVRNLLARHPEWTKAVIGAFHDAATGSVDEEDDSVIEDKCDAFLQEEPEEPEPEPKRPRLVQPEWMQPSALPQAETGVPPAMLPETSMEPTPLPMPFPLPLMPSGNILM
ncbi:MAG: hypothetical protein MHM6MM_003670 [Cercozoa sp. M6MM]